MESWSEENCYCSEPVYISEPAETKEDSGLLICSLLWGKPSVNTTAILVLSAKDLSPIARWESSTKSMKLIALLDQGVIHAAWTSPKTPAWLFLALLGLPGLTRGESRFNLLKYRTLQQCCLQLCTSLIWTGCISGVKTIDLVRGW